MTHADYGAWQDQFFDGPPDIVGTVRGYRTWRIDNGMLYSPYREHLWHPGLNIATCLVRHRAPFPSCTCGFYSYYLPTSIIGWHQVYGVVENQDAIELQSRGMRSEKTRIVALCTRDKNAQWRLAMNYPDAKIYRSRRKMWRAFPPAKEVCGVPTHRIVHRFKPVRVVAMIMNGFIWAQFGSQIPHDWTNVIYPLIFSIFVILLTATFG